VKVQALNHIHQQVGSVSVERVLGSVFDLPLKDAIAASEAGLVLLLEPVPTSKPKLETR
jgi:hypothetical protein